MNVVFLDTAHEVLDQMLAQNGYTTLHWEDKPTDWIKENIHIAEGIVIRSRIPMNSEFLALAPNLQFIARSGAGMENIDLDYCDAHQIECFNAPEGNRNAVAEHALGMLLALFNRITIGDNEIRNGEWRREANRGVELDGKTVGIIGFGNNGSAFAQKLKGFDVKILAYDKYKSGFGDNYIYESSLKDILEHADIISLHIPLTDETRMMVNQSFWESCKKSVYFINLSRGPIVNTQDLVNAIKDRTVMGACLDVLEHEKSSFENFFKDSSMPKDLQALLSLENVIVSPHVGGWTHESYYKLSKVLADKIISTFHQKP